MDSSTYVVSVILIFFAIIDVEGVCAAPLRRAGNAHWHSASATWYGSPNGDGSDGKFLKNHTYIVNIDFLIR